ncbi:class I SAM-dependent methyltransferase [Legionella sp. 227]|uniref:class I SAM-dependent methyltransferase n=1 Tax=Legionella sp. 227 TaxID=3367288 RepID=UPI00370D672D
MAQITHGIRSILSYPIIYSLFQALMGAHKARTLFTQNFIKPYSGMKILDIGCGPAEILNYLKDVEYYGFDVCNAYITKAQSIFGDRGNFYCKEFELNDLDNIPKVDVVLAIGLLHHLDDDTLIKMLRLAFSALKPGGRLITLDPCFVKNQNPIAKFLIAHDRGRNVRTEKGYAELVSKVFPSFEIQIQHKKWIPYTHCITESIKN